MSNEHLKPIVTLKSELERKLHILFDEFQRRPECRGLKIQGVHVKQVDWHNGHGSVTPENELRSDAVVGWRVLGVELHLVIE